MSDKTLMLLGGIRYLLPVIESAHREGYHVITVDNIPGNVAHKFSDRYCNVSVTDLDGVLEAASDCRIDGILSFACDPGVIAASYVQNRLGLPSIAPFESVCILQDKSLFRSFLSENGFNVPDSFIFSGKEEAFPIAEKLKYPIIVKPVDSAGSKGVSMVECSGQLGRACENALSHSLSGRGIMESVITAMGHPSDSDCYVENGILKFPSFSSQYFDGNAANPFTPAAFCWPSSFSEDEENLLALEIQRAASLLKIETSVFNVETRMGTDGKPYIMEMSPRGGGNRICEMLRHAFAVDLIAPSVRWAVGDESSFDGKIRHDGYWGEVILHSLKSGVFRNLSVSKEVESHIVERDLWVSRGDCISLFSGANAAIGTLVLRYDSESELRDALANQKLWLEVVIE